MNQRRGGGGVASAVSLLFDPVNLYYSSPHHVRLMSQAVKQTGYQPRGAILSSRALALIAQIHHANCLMSRVTADAQMSAYIHGAELQTCFKYSITAASPLLVDGYQSVFGQTVDQMSDVTTRQSN